MTDQKPKVIMANFDAIDVDKEVDRIIRLMDVGIEAVRNGDGDAAVMAAKEALETAQRLPKKSDKPK